MQPMLHLTFKGTMELRLPPEFKIVDLDPEAGAGSEAAHTAIVFPYSRGRVRFLFAKMKEQRFFNAIASGYMSNATDVLKCGVEFISNLKEERFDEHLGMPDC